MKTKTKSSNRSSGNALVITMVLTATALLTLSGVMAWSTSGARVSTRYNQYTRAVAAAEAAAEKAGSKLSSDFLSGGEALVSLNLSSYASLVPAATDSSYWTGWHFSDGQGNTGKTFVGSISTSNFLALNSTYAGLNGYISIYDVVSNARQDSDMQNVTGAVLEQLLLTRIPIFQFAMYSSDDMEISCGENFELNGPVHSNGNLYVEPDSTLQFDSPVTAVGNILFSRDPLDSRGAPGGSVTYETNATPNSPVLTLPIGATNTSAAIAQIIQPPPSGESATSALGLQRFYNKVDLVVKVTSSGITGTSGNFNSFNTTIPSNQLALFVSTSNSFYDARESKTVKSIDINIGMLTKWSATNTVLRSAFSSPRDLCSVYVNDQRGLSGANLGGVRVYNGLQLPSLGLTLATQDPLYVLGNYNQTNALNLNTSNTTTSLPAMLAGDAITQLSTLWSDANSSSTLALRLAGPTTLNAALIAGSVYTTNGNYSGGMENFIRYLESWGVTVSTYNGSMVKLYPSSLATNTWGGANVYDPPARNYSFDNNFNVPAKLPPLTPSLQTIARSQWATVAPNSTVASTNAF